MAATVTVAAIATIVAVLAVTAAATTTIDIIADTDLILTGHTLGQDLRYQVTVIQDREGFPGCGEDVSPVLSMFLRVVHSLSSMRRR